ncbi:MAG: PH domain-containing protein [bacterium]|nr:PH domain-containing protein [bacterium]
MEAAMTPLDPRVRTQWRIEALAASLVATLGIVIGAFQLPLAWWGRLGLIVVAAAAIGGGLQFVASLRYRYWKYGLADDVLILEHGVWTRRRSTTPYFRVQNVDLSQGPLERWLGLKRLTIRTASAFTDASIPGLDADAAEQLRLRILERAGRDAAV